MRGAPAFRFGPDPGREALARGERIPAKRLRHVLAGWGGWREGPSGGQGCLPDGTPPVGPATGELRDAKDAPLWRATGLSQGGKRRHRDVTRWGARSIPPGGSPRRRGATRWLRRFWVARFPERSPIGCVSLLVGIPGPFPAHPGRSQKVHSRKISAMHFLGPSGAFRSPSRVSAAPVHHALARNPAPARTEEALDHCPGSPPRPAFRGQGQAASGPFCPLKAPRLRRQPARRLLTAWPDRDIIGAGETRKN